MLERDIKKNSHLSLYYQLKKIIIDMIDNGDLNENDKIPTEKQLCKAYDISRATVRQALNELENEDYIFKVQGKGTFVSPVKFQQDLLDFYSFTNEMKKIGKKPRSKVLNFDITTVDQEKILSMLDINRTEKLYKFLRLRLADDEPMMIETTYIPHKYFPGINKENLEKKPLYDILTNDFKVIFSKAEEIFKATLTTEKEAKQLNFINGGPAFMLERITYNKKGCPIEYTKSIARGDKFKYHVELEK